MAEAAGETLAIVGARGFVGRSLCRLASERGWNVIRITRGERMLHGPARTTPDLEQGADLMTLVGGASVCVNLAARVHVTRPGSPASELPAHRSMNRDFALRLAKAARDGGGMRFIQMSTVAAVTSTTAPGQVADDATEPQPASPYGIAKLEADRQIAQLSGREFSTISLRPPAIFGPGVGAQFACLMAVARRGIPLPVGAIDNARSFAFVDNIADAILTTAKRTETGAFIVTDSAPLSTAELYRRLLVLYGHRPLTPRVPAFLLQKVAAMALGDRVTSLIGNAAYDGSRFGRVFGWQPTTGFEEALSRTVQHDLESHRTGLTSETRGGTKR